VAETGTRKLTSERQSLVKPGFSKFLKLARQWKRPIKRGFPNARQSHRQKAPVSFSVKNMQQGGVEA
jgi:hypothetical protein